MNSLKFLQKFQKYVSLTRFGIINPLKPTTVSVIRNRAFPTILLASSLFTVKTDYGGKVVGEKPAYYSSKLKEECIGSEKKINVLMTTLQNAIIDTCAKYRAVLQKQIDMLETGIDMDPLDKYWDNLVPLRIEADNMKKDFESYRNMVDYVGQLAFNLAFCSAMISNLDSQDFVCNEYSKLEKITKEQLEENKIMEDKLLQKNMQNILQTNTATQGLKKIAQDLKKNVDNVLEEHSSKKKRLINT